MACVESQARSYKGLSSLRGKGQDTMLEMSAGADCPCSRGYLVDPGLHPKSSEEPLESVKQRSDLVRTVFWVAILAAVGVCDCVCVGDVLCSSRRQRGRRPERRGCLRRLSDVGAVCAAPSPDL